MFYHKMNTTQKKCVDDLNNKNKNKVKLKT